MQKDKKEARAKGLDRPELEDQDFIQYKKALNHMSQLDKSLSDQQIEEDYKKRRVQVT